MYCSNCGKEVSDKAVVCIHCGVALKPEFNPSGEPEVDGFDWLVTLLLCVFLGSLGIHRFYTKNIGIGVVQLVTLGGCGIWTLIDLILIIVDGYHDGYGRPLARKKGY